MKSKKEKKVNKLSILLAVVLLICLTCAVAVSAESSDSIIGDTCYSLGDINEDGAVSEKDAVYLLYHSVYPEEYPLSWGGDFAEDNNEINVKDAIYLLNHVHDADFAGKMIHAYSEPIWTWKTEVSDVSAVATYSCACGDADSVKVVDAVIKTETKAATCIENGSIKYEATAVYLNQEHHAEKVEEQEASGHSFEKAKSACEDRTCTNEGCDYVEKADAHVYTMTKQEATCTTAAVATYTCENCGDTYTNEEGIPLSHKLDNGTLVHVEGCNYETVYTCTVCEEVVEKEAVVKHAHVATITTEATCTEAGVKTYACVCGDKYTEAIDANANAHSWGEGVTDGAITTYSCTICNATRTTINANEEKTTTVASEDLSQTGEVELNHTAIKLDEATLGQLTGEVAISAETADKSALNLDAELAAQIGENPVYDFSITSDGNAVSEFDGEVTISLPYEIAEDEDADCIDVWFIKDDGTVEVQQGTYSNGFVTFTTDHFSYYTVTRLTPKQRCEKYGCSLSTRKIAATCEAEGYTLGVCVRCGETSKTDVVEALGHDCEVVTVAATCTKAGKETETCKREGCKYTRKSTIAALGHTWEVTDSQEVSCAAAGYEKSECSTCGETKYKEFAQLPHTFEAKSVTATCTEKGYAAEICTECNYAKGEKETAALGHDYEAVWQWNNEAEVSADLKLSCQREDCNHSVMKNGAVKVIAEVDATCESDGIIRYNATVAHNGKTYKSDEYTVTLPALGHNMSTEWKYNNATHYHICERCELRADVAEHVLGEAVVTTPATCTEKGVKTSACECGYKVEEEIPTLGHKMSDNVQVKEATCTEDGLKTYTCENCGTTIEEKLPSLGHDIVNDVCTRCGYRLTDCDHGVLNETKLDLSEYGMCSGTFAYNSCECGENTFLSYYDLHCNMRWNTEVIKDANGFVQNKNTAVCKDCGFSIEETYSFEVGENCIGTSYVTFVLFNKNKEQIFVFEGISETDAAHLQVIEKSAMSLADLGLCGGVVREMSCVCGAETETWIEESCDWNHVTGGPGFDQYQCQTCGTVKDESWVEKDLGNCQYDVTYRKDYYRNDVSVYTYEENYISQYHNCEYTFELDGTSCSDGYTVYEKCKDCDYENSYYQKTLAGEHRMYWQMMDVTEYDLCVDSIEVSACPCGEESWSNIANNCNLRWISSDSVTSDGTGIQRVMYQVCNDCGLNVETTTVTIPTEDLCKNEETARRVFSKNGVTIVTTKETYFVDNHNGNVIDRQLAGTSCEDGVTVTYECVECGEVYTDTYYYHESGILESHDLGKLGLCGGTVSVVGCACGQDKWINEDSNCDWEFYYYDEEKNIDTFRCTECGMFRKQIYEQEIVSGCQTKYVQTYVYESDSTELLEVEVIGYGYNHNDEYEFELDGETCSDGFMVIATCKECGRVDSWHVKPSQGYHNEYRLKEYDLKDYGFCGGYVYEYGCPCGELSSIGWNYSIGCSWTWDSYDSNSNVTWYRCTECGGFRAEQQGQTATDGCYQIAVTTYKFFNKDLVEKLSLQKEQTYENHTYEYSFNLDGESCSDGYEYTATCKVCGDTSVRYNKPMEGQHPTYVLETHQLKDYGFCGIEIKEMGCPCGANSYMNWNSTECNLVYGDWDDEYNSPKTSCAKCGNYFVQPSTSKPLGGCKYEITNTYHFFNKEGEEVYTYDYSTIQENHQYIATFELEGESCYDGYTVYLTCKECGQETESYGTYHNTYVVDMVDFGKLGLCEGTITRNSCACGYQSYISQNTMCSYSYEGYDEETQTQKYKCNTCGVVKTENTVTGEKDENCSYVSTTYIKYWKDGEVVYEYSRNNLPVTSHNYVYEYELLGDSCEDGYYLITACKDCDYSYKEDYLYTSHMTRRVETFDAKELGMCEGTFGHNVCACGEYDQWYVNTNCMWEERYDYDTGSYIYTCSKCGVERTYESVETEIDACHSKYENIYTYTKDGEEIFKHVSISNSYYHQYLYEFTLNTENGTCYDGYTAIGTCRKCGETTTETGSYHYNYLVDYVDLAEAGMCVGTMTVSKCPCGENEYYNLYSNCSWSYQGSDETGATRSVCVNCNAEKVVIATKDEKDENCNVAFTTISQYYNGDGEWVCETVSTGSVPEHDYEITDVVMQDENDCSKGYYEVYTCSDCEYSYESHWAGHNTRVLKEYYLADFGGCEGSGITYSSCYCGKYQNMGTDFYGSCDIIYTSNTYKDEEGYSHDVYVYRCENCKLRFTHDQKSVRDTATCTETITNNITIVVGDTAVDGFEYTQTRPYHEYEETVALRDGAQDCEDGVIITYTCKNCNDSYTSNGYGHMTVEVPGSRIDLTTLGSVCGGYVVQKQCACGAINELYLEDMDCDRSGYYEDPWLGEEASSQFTTNGWVYPERDAWRWTCAVTDPVKCGFTIRECDYYVWDKDNCQMTAYTTWQLGYDVTDGSYEKEITIPTGNSFAYHDYEVTELPDGAEGICKTCASTYKIVSGSDENGYYSEQEASNTLENGENKYYHSANEYVYYKNNSYNVKDHYERIYADNSTYWYKNDYAYDWDNFDCTCIRTYSNSYGESGVETLDCHRISGHHEQIKDATCTQYGAYKYVYQCGVCGALDDEEEYLEYPNGHAWMYDYDLGIYECYSCGLQNTNGADGSVVLEDMSADYGNDANYVIGYWNKQQVEYRYYVTVVYGSGEDEMELILNDIEFTELTRDNDGINAITFVKADADAAAKDAVEAEGYEGEYALRFVFVPVGSDGDFDYAITLTDEDLTE